jgi:4-hydroxy-tetrahydrodipicolinate synthase
MLLYDLPSFTTPLHTETVVDLLSRVPTIVGIKDSSGVRERLTELVARRGDRDWRLIVGDDNVLPDAMAAGWDGSISGVAGFCPELLVALTEAARAGQAERTAELYALLQALIARLGTLPTPWGIRVGLEGRGIPTGPLPLPLSARRTEQVDGMLAWLPSWFERVGSALGTSMVDA